jgi:tape measure domain-containing protein
VRANRYVSYLAAEVEPRATTTINQFEQSIERTFSRIERFSSGGRSGLGLGVSANDTRQLRASEVALRRARGEIVQTGAAARRTAADASLMANAFSRSAIALQVVQGPLGPMAGRLSALGAAMRTLTGFALTGVLAGGGAFALGSIATQYQNVSDRLRPLFDNQRQFNQAMNQVVSIAGNTRQALQPIADLYASITQAANDAGIAQQRIPGIVETVAKAARLSGGAQESQNAAIVQFTQAFGAGFHGSGQELQSIREQAPRLGRAIAEGLGVTTAQLRQLAQDGRLSADLVARALERSAAKIDVEFSRIPRRMNQSVTEFGRNLSVFVGDIDNATGATTFFANVLHLVATNLNNVAAIAGVALVAFNARTLINQFRTIETTIDGVRTTQTGVVAGMGNWVARQRDIYKSTLDINRAAAEGRVTILGSAEAARQKAQFAVEGAQSEIAAATATQTALTRSRGLYADQVTSIQEVIAAQNLELAQARELAADAARDPRVAAARARVVALQEELAAAVATKAAYDRQFASFGRAQSLITSNPALSNDRRDSLLAANALAARDAQLALAQAEVRADAAARHLAASMLALAEVEGTAVTEAAARLAAAEEALNGSLARQAGLVSTLAVNDNTLAAAEIRLAEATGVLTVAEERLAVAQAAAPARSARMAAASAVLSRAWGGLMSAGSSLVAFLGGGWGVAFTAATAALIYFATRSDAARDAVRDLQVEAGGLDRAMQGVAASTLDAARELARLQSLRAQDQISDASDSLTQVRRGLAQQIRDQLIRARTGSGMIAMPGVGISMPGDQASEQMVQRVNRLTESLERGNINALGVLRSLTNISHLRPDIISPEFVRRISRSTGNADTEGPLQSVAGSEESFNRINRTAQQRLEAAQGPPPVMPVARTRQQIEAAAAEQAARTDLERARADLQQIRAQGRQDNESEDQYITRLADARKHVTDLMNAERDRRRANAAGRREAAARETASDKQDRLDNLMDRFTVDTPIRRLQQLQNQAAAAKRAIDDLVGERVGDHVFTRAEATEKKQQVDDFVATESRRPVREALTDMQAQVTVQGLLLHGNQAMSEFVARRLELEKQVGALLPQEALDLANQQQHLREINRAQEERNRKIELYAGMMGQARDAAQDLIRNFADDPFRSLGTFATRLRSAFLDARARELTVRIFGDPEQTWRDQMTGAMDHVADRLTTSGETLQSAGDSLQQAAGAIQAATAGNGGVGGPFEPVNGPPAGATPGQIANYNAWHAADAAPATNISMPPAHDAPDAAWQTWYDSIGRSSTAAAAQPSILDSPALNSSADSLGRTADILDQILPAISDTADASQAIVVTARTRPADAKLPRNVTEAMNHVGEVLAGKVFGPNSLFTRAFSKLGTFLEGTAYGSLGGNLAHQLTGARTSQLGSQIGGGLGQIGGEMLGGVLKSTLGSLGTFAGPLGAIAGGVIGGLLGGLLKPKPKAGEAQVSNTGIALTGNSASLNQQASGLGDSIQSGIQRIMDALGGTAGAYSVSIGTYKDTYRVNTSGGPTHGDANHTNFGSDQEAAVKFAILDALKDGAVQGIREGSKRLLQAGKDLDTALQKALSFENVFRRLKARTDPVGAAVDDVNREFATLISTFKEAGASAADWADLEKLYGYERADAIKNALSGALGPLSDFIQSITAGPDSPLGKRTVYENAKKAIDPFAADIGAGKAVDSDALVKALEDFQSASEALYGSRSPFFKDFDQILALAEAARTNIGGAITGDNPNLPASPFDDELRKTFMSQLTETQTQTGLLTDIRGLLGGGTGAGAGGGGGDIPTGGDGSALQILPDVGYDRNYRSLGGAFQ